MPPITLTTVAAPNGKCLGFTSWPSQGTKAAINDFSLFICEFRRYSFFSRDIRQARTNVLLPERIRLSGSRLVVFRVHGAEPQVLT